MRVILSLGMVSEITEVFQWDFERFWGQVFTRWGLWGQEPQCVVTEFIECSRSWLMTAARDWRNKNFQVIPAWPTASNSSIPDHMMDLSTLYGRCFLSSYLFRLWEHLALCAWGDGKGQNQLLPQCHGVLVYAEKHSNAFLSQRDPLRARTSDLSGLFKKWKPSSNPRASTVIINHSGE